MKKLKDSEDYSYPLLLKLVLVSIAIRFLAGFVGTVFGRALLFLSDFRTGHFNYLILFSGTIGLLIVFLCQKTDERTSKGVGLAFAAGQSQEEEIPPILVPLVILVTWLTHLFGGSAGREGVVVQLGAAVVHSFSRSFDFENNSRLFLITDMAAGFAGLFQTPAVAVFFTLEILVFGKLQSQVLLLMTVASFVASVTSHSSGLEKLFHLVSTDLILDMMTFCKLAALGIIFGLVGNLFVKLLAIAKEKAKDVMNNSYYRILSDGILLSLIPLMCYHGCYSGLGANLIEASFAGKEIYLYDWLFRLLLTVATLAIGFQGGEVTPLSAIGASLGVVLANLSDLPVEFVAAAGYVSVSGSATDTLIAPIFTGGEAFGFANLPYLVVAMIFAYSVNRRRSTYGGQEVLTFQMIYQQSLGND